MKKYTLCVMALLGFLLLSCTMLSAKIEEEMLTQVVIMKITPQKKGRKPIVLSPKCLVFDDETVDKNKAGLERSTAGYHLYQVKNGTGWEDGLRIREIPTNAYFFDAMGDVLSGFDETKSWMFVQYASRRPEDGKKAEVLDTKGKSRERYLVIYPEQVPEIDRALSGMSIMTKTPDTLLLEVEKSPQPFLRERAGRELGDLNTPGCEIYSVDTAEQFLKNLPAVAGVAVLLFAGPVIWVQSLFFTGNPWEHRWWLVADALLGLGLLWGLGSLLGQIDLPSDLLPTDNILEWSHYSREFSQIFSALAETRGSLFESMKHLGRTGQHTINLALHTVKQVKTIAVIGTALPLLWSVAPLAVHAWKKRKTGRD